MRRSGKKPLKTESDAFDICTSLFLSLYLSTSPSRNELVERGSVRHHSGTEALHSGDGEAGWQMYLPAVWFDSLTQLSFKRDLVD
ncbi:hypothetical protein DRN79_04300 [Methanosarcinales archaeon]|nr:MAG: hypothetical protein DRN79_04300 [Methanosarcinales archaeon]